jgi:outer membrane protein OmpA-like peptidoglycan-associated protein
MPRPGRILPQATPPDVERKGNLAMRHFHSRLNRIALVATGTMLLAGAPVFAQTVRVFDDAPSIEQLRSIMVPESQPGMSRSIVIQRPDTDGGSAPVQRASTNVMPAPRTPVAAADLSASPVVHAMASVPQPALAVTPASKPAAPHPTVGFRINFAFNSAVLPGPSYTMIERVAQVMKETPEIKVRVEGHTDSVGSADFNVALSERRALSVAEYLVKQGVEPSRLMVIGKGMAEPLTPNGADPANRRVQFVRVG